VSARDAAGASGSGMTGTDLVPRWRVRPGRECRVCGEDRLSMMKAHARRPDGHENICKVHHAEQMRARYSTLARPSAARLWAARRAAVSSARLGARPR
jgi:hypothetical protein